MSHSSSQQGAAGYDSGRRGPAEVTQPVRTELGQLAACVRALQEAQMQTSYDADAMGRQLAEVQRQMLALSRRLTTIEARLAQRAQGQGGERASDGAEGGDEGRHEP